MQRGDLFARAKALNQDTWTEGPADSWSTQDMAVGQAAAQKCGEYVDAAYRLVILDGVSHWIPEHAPDQLAAAILDHLAST